MCLELGGRGGLMREWETNTEIADECSFNILVRKFQTATQVLS